MPWLPLVWCLHGTELFSFPSKQRDGYVHCKQTCFELALSQALGDANHSPASRWGRGPGKTGGFVTQQPEEQGSHQLLWTAVNIDPPAKTGGVISVWQQILWGRGDPGRQQYVWASGWSWALLCVWPEGGADVHLAISLLKRSQWTVCFQMGPVLQPTNFISRDHVLTNQLQERFWTHKATDGASTLPKPSHSLPTSYTQTNPKQKSLS